MAIVKMNRFSLLTFERYKPDLLKRLQAFEQVHFRRLSAEDFESGEFAPGLIKRNIENAQARENDLQRVTFASDRLKPFATIPKGLKAMTKPPAEMTFDELDRYTADYDSDTVCESVRVCDERLKTAQAELARIKTENENLKVWSGFDTAPAELDRMKHVRYMIGSVNKNAAADFTARLNAEYPAAYIEALHTVKDDAAFFIMSSADEWDALSAELKALGFTRSQLSFTGIPAEKILENEKRSEELASEIESLNDELKLYAGNYQKLLIAADYYRSALERARVCENFMNLSDVLLVEGWTPQDKSGDLNKILNGVCGEDYYIEETAVEPDSLEVPIALKNNKFVTPFEDVTSMFSMPKYNEIDPTPLLTPFYLLFFGLMVGDAGYGIVLTIATAVILKFFHLKKSMVRFFTFFFYLSFGVIFAGLLYGSFFGNPFFQIMTNPATGEPKAILDSGVDILMMLILSIAVGVVQVLFGFGIKAYMAFRDGKPGEAFMDSILWIITLVSALGMLVAIALPSFAGIEIPGIIGSIAKWGLIGGLIALLCTQGRSSPSIAGKFGNGLLGVYNITSYAGDFISYTRLAAIALSGAYIASSFNMMAGMIPFPVSIIFGTAIFLVGNALNMGLGLLGAYVHGCRLMFVEFFGKFYEGGGVPFKPFAPKNIYVTLK